MFMALGLPGTHGGEVHDVPMLPPWWVTSLEIPALSESTHAARRQVCG